jgi:RNA polymerase sigma-70 factor, ECF subfamily
MDRGLLEAHKRGDPGALEAIVRLHGASVLGYLRKMCGNDQAEDMFQETFKKVYQSAHAVRGEKLRPWLFAVATNVAIDGMRKRKRFKFISFAGGEEGDGPAGTVADDKSDPPGEAMLEELRGIVRAEIAGLPDRMRATLIMAYYEGLSYAEIAECMGCSVGTVKTQMFRALKTLAERLPEAAGDAE